MNLSYTLTYLKIVGKGRCEMVCKMSNIANIPMVNTHVIYICSLKINIKVQIFLLMNIRVLRKLLLSICVTFRFTGIATRVIEFGK